jgi:hypothetical protein
MFWAAAARKNCSRTNFILRQAQATQSDLILQFCEQRPSLDDAPRTENRQGLRPGRRNSGESEPQLHISKEGDPYLRTLMVQSAHHILGPFGGDSDLRRWGLRLAQRGGKNAKKRAVVAVARKLAI